MLWAGTAATSRYSSLSALVASFVTPIFLWWFGHLALASLFAVLTMLLFYMHRENIKRLQAGTQGRLGEKEWGWLRPSFRGTRLRLNPRCASGHQGIPGFRGGGNVSPGM